MSPVFAQGIGGGLCPAAGRGGRPGGPSLAAVLTSIPPAPVSQGMHLPGMCPPVQPGDGDRAGGTRGSASAGVCPRRGLAGAGGYKAEPDTSMRIQGGSSTGNMGHPWLCLLCLLGSGLILLGTPEPVPGVLPPLSLPGQSREETELVEVLQEVLEKLGTRDPPALEKRLSWVPSCEPGEPCAVRRGARIGKLCSCPRGTSCNLFILKCS
ncbi:cocaine- and amphetamine-regulated transcript protein-like [Pipra filicauda]|uniref:Cocaine- and amphetamine-regulated transcript protein n=2 Tax=Pipridae TaxID=114313 RepID=A0A6J2HI51_9PASS|nr:cocaine- and amphetamine-regulated transcript protein-like [Pipra filicauda]